MERTAVVTGASAGVGRATERRLAEEGLDVALLARGRDGLEGARREPEGMGRRALAIPTDVADPDQVEAAAERAEAELGPIDVRVNNAMTTVFSPFSEIEPEEFKRAAEVADLGIVWGTRDALRWMRPRDRRSMVSTVDLPGLNTPRFEHCRPRLPNQPQPVPPNLRSAARSGCPRSSSRYGSQQTDQPVNADRPDNLFSPVPRDEGAHGPFDERARKRSPLLWLAKHRKAVGAAAVAGIGATAAAAGATSGGQKQPRRIFG